MDTADIKETVREHYGNIAGAAALRIAVPRVPQPGVSIESAKANCLREEEDSLVGELARATMLSMRGKTACKIPRGGQGDLGTQVNP